MSISVTSSKPDSISSIIVLSTKTEIQGCSSPIYNNFISTKHNAVLNFRTLPVERVTTKHMQSTDNFSLSFREGDRVMFTCMGDIGNPPGKLIWQKTFPQGKKPITYSNETTYIEEIPGQCSFHGTSHLTVKLYAEDIKATICCFEESQVNVIGMYLETEPFDIQCELIYYLLFWENEENYYQTLSLDGITINAEYASVIHAPNRHVGESGDNLVCSNGKEGNENKSRKNASDRTIVYDEINQQTTLNNEVSKAQMSVSTDNGDHYDAICMDVAIQSSVNDG
ncbi:unnamed protein product [Mytilus edulis]|uniref:Uncharacterized protein n=1 Tax=Mytilus edulis TaxID=6550 RepID=A0A8S3V9W1_MYTED|nr:unnamed protein product [Mytilus edulis]